MGGRSLNALLLLAQALSNESPHHDMGKKHHKQRVGRLLSNWHVLSVVRRRKEDGNREWHLL